MSEMCTWKRSVPPLFTLLSGHYFVVLDMLFLLFICCHIFYLLTQLISSVTHLLVPLLRFVSPSLEVGAAHTGRHWSGYCPHKNKKC